MCLHTFLCMRFKTLLTWKSHLAFAKTFLYRHLICVIFLHCWRKLKDLKKRLCKQKSVNFRLERPKVYWLRSESFGRHNLFYAFNLVGLVRYILYFHVFQTSFQWKDTAALICLLTFYLIPFPSFIIAQHLIILLIFTMLHSSNIQIPQLLMM